MTAKEAADLVMDACDMWEKEWDCGEDWSDVHEARDMAISALEAQESSQNVPNGDFISRKAAIDGISKHEKEVSVFTDREADVLWNNAIGRAEMEIEKLPSAQPEPLLDEIVDEIRKTIAETESNGKYHADSVRHNGEMICHGLQIALNIIEEKRNERSD